MPIPEQTCAKALVDNWAIGMVPRIQFIPTKGVISSPTSLVSFAKCSKSEKLEQKRFTQQETYRERMPARASRDH